MKFTFTFFPKLIILKIKVNSDPSLDRLYDYLNFKSYYKELFQKHIPTQNYHDSIDQLKMNSKTSVGYEKIQSNLYLLPKNFLIF